MVIDEHRIHQVFRLSVILKGLHALLEIAAGAAFWLFDSRTILHWTSLLTADELREEPHDFVATHLLAAAQSLGAGTQAFYAFYLISHGLVKVALVWGLLRGKLAAYPLSLAVLALFIAYQLYRYSFTHSIGLIVLTAFDLLVMALVWHEWRLLRRHLPVA